MNNLKIKFTYPKYTKIKDDRSLSFNDTKRQIKSEVFFTENRNKVTQTITKTDDNIIKITNIKKVNKLNPSEEFKNVQKISKDGEFISVRLIDDIFYDSYVFKPYEKLLNNKYPKNIKGLMQKILWYIYNDKNGCERKFIKNIANLIK